MPTAPEMETPFRTTTPSTPAMTATTAKQVDSVHVHTLPVLNTSWSGLPTHCAPVNKPLKQVFKPGDSLALRNSSTHTMEGLLLTDPLDEAGHSVTLFWLL